MYRSRLLIYRKILGEKATTNSLDKSIIRMAPMDVEPTADGVVTPEEQRASAVRNHGST